jgi:hypothetical protein
MMYETIEVRVMVFNITFNNITLLNIKNQYYISTHYKQKFEKLNHDRRRDTDEAYWFPGSMIVVVVAFSTN